MKGHQDKGVRSLSLTKALNVIADVRAKVALYEYIISAGSEIKLQSNKAIIGGVKINSKLLPTNIVSNLRQVLSKVLAKEHIMNFWT